MSRPIAFFALLFCISSPAQPPQARHNSFRWDYHKAQEPDGDHTLAKASGLSAADNAAAHLRIMQLMRPFFVEERDALKRNPAEIVNDTRLRLIDLNGDGIPEVIASPSGADGECGAANCVLWVLQKSPSGYRTILDTSNGRGTGGVQSFTLMESKTSGFRDLILAAHDSARDSTLYIYRFGKGRYLARECYEASWPWDMPDNADVPPTITPCKRAGAVGY